MSVDELWALHEQIVLLLASKMSEEKAQLEWRLGKLKAEFTAPHPYPPVLPKYRNPVRPSETWAGRGRRPRWLSAQLRNGKQLDDFRILAS